MEKSFSEQLKILAIGIGLLVQFGGMIAMVADLRTTLLEVKRVADDTGKTVESILRDHESRISRTEGRLQQQGK